jgi:uncharacterized protein YbjT (DUF2867 family)
MRIVVLGGTGQLGEEVVRLLRDRGEEVVVASRSNGVDTIKNVGLESALRGADALVDVTNALIFETDTIVDFFTTSTRNTMAAELAAGVAHHVAISIVGMDRIEPSGYLGGKVAQERVIAEGQVPSTIVRATQFFEFLPTILDAQTVEGSVRVPAAAFQPIATADVALALVDTVLAGPGPEVVEVAGPERMPMAGFLRRVAKPDDQREIVEEASAPYFGVPVAADALVPLGDARVGELDYATWVGR